MQRPNSDGMGSVECPLCFHIYRIGGLWAEDKIVKDEDRITNRYFLRGARSLANWQFTLHAGSSSGALVCRVNSPYIGPPLMQTDPGPIIITMASERRPTYIHRESGATDGTHLFKGPDDKEYRWRPTSGLWRHKLQCLDPQNQVVATYRVTILAISKDGELCVNPRGHFMIDLLMATCLAMRTPDH
ncbi:hypothetical protein PAXRUDRAFT_831188 [Paxillus rubicundulus Ve08.2h10]|uniref:Unplaced genomic scaffold scaffold_616, whole genome shotgun sequence n=1 Tax=Paxillus rubicundulus Ve08.2h10 TaxID=930991 RepID=A0A0D0DJ04_9AGAM|nr:hypothetical protein PAXRUDRAFT_831188 [Paxillus rubicundulus Ve08.2h10]